MSKRRTNNGWDEEEDDDWTKVKFDDDDDEEDAKRSKFKFQIKLAPSSPPSANGSNSDSNSSHNAVEQTNGHREGEGEGDGGGEEKDAVVRLAPLLALPKQQSSSMRGRRWGQKESDSNDEFEQIIKRASLTESDQAKYTITPDDLEDHTKDYVGIPAIVVHPFVPDSPNELQLNLGEAVLILSTHTHHQQQDISAEDQAEASDPVWYYGRLLREQQNASSTEHDNKSNDSNSSTKPTIRQKAGFFSSHFVVKLCEESLSFDTAKFVAFCFLPIVLSS